MLGRLPPPTRTKLFFGICIPLRILIGVLLWTLLDDSIPKPNVDTLKLKDATVGLVMVITLFSTIYLAARSIEGGTWWSRPVEAIIVAIMFVLGFAYFMGKSEVSRSSNSEGVGADRTPSGVRYRSERASSSGKAHTFEAKWIAVPVWIDVLLGIIAYILYFE